MSVPRSLLIAMGTVLVASLLAVAFLLGRESSRQDAARAPLPSPTAVPATVASVPAPAPATSAPSPPPAAPTAPAPPPPSPRMPPVTIAAPPRPAAPAPTETPTQRATPAPARKVPGHEAVAAYFKRMDNLQPGRLTDDPNEFATQVLDSAMKGDTSGIDHLIEDADRTEQQARALHPPPACRHYHAAALELMGESHQMLVILRAAMKRGDAGAVTDMGTQAASLKSRVEALDAEERAIKRKFGVP